MKYALIKIIAAILPYLVGILLVYLLFTFEFITILQYTLIASLAIGIFLVIELVGKIILAPFIAVALAFNFISQEDFIKYFID